MDSGSYYKLISLVLSETKINNLKHLLILEPIKL